MRVQAGRACACVCLCVLETALHCVYPTCRTPLCREARIHGRLGWKERPLTRLDLVLFVVAKEQEWIEDDERMTCARHNPSSMRTHMLWQADSVCVRERSSFTHSNLRSRDMLGAATQQGSPQQSLLLPATPCPLDARMSK